MKRTVLALAIILVFVLSACGHKSKQIKLVDAVDQIRGMEDYAPVGDLPRAFSEKVVYEVLSISWNGDSGIAKVKVTTPDLKQIISNSIKKAIDERGTEEYNVLLDAVKENIQAVLNARKCPTFESTVEMGAEKAGESYVLISNEEFRKIIQGNLEEVFLSALKEQMSEGQ
jgi:uncharacterized lipoprotein